MKTSLNMSRTSSGSGTQWSATCWAARRSGRTVPADRPVCQKSWRSWHHGTTLWSKAKLQIVSSSLCSVLASSRSSVSMPRYQFSLIHQRFLQAQSTMGGDIRELVKVVALTMLSHHRAIHNPRCGRLSSYRSNPFFKKKLRSKLCARSSETTRLSSYHMLQKHTVVSRVGSFKVLWIIFGQQLP